MTSTEPIGPERAEQALSELQGAVAALRDSEHEEDDDTAWGVLRDVVRWALDIDPRTLDGSYGGYLVVLDERVKDEDADMMLQVLLRIGGVIAVSPVREDAQAYFATARLQRRLRDHLSEALNGFHWHETETPEERS